MLQNADSFRKYIESAVLNVVRQLALQPDVKPERVEQIAAHALLLIKPGMTLEQLMMNAVKLDDSFSELATVVRQVMSEYEKTHEKKAVGVVSQLIQSGQYDQAQNVVKKVLAFKSQ